MYKGREKYKFSPLILVAAEVRVTYSPLLRKQDTLDAIAMELGDELPVVMKGHQTAIAVSPEGIKQQGEALPQWKLLNRESTIAATISPTAIVLETTDYSDFDDFAALYDRLCRAVDASSRTAAVERLGLRYIDEIRVPVKINEVRDWHGWVSQPMLDALDVACGRPVSSAETRMSYELGSQRYLNFRFAALEGTGVVGNDPLRRRYPQHEPSPFFVLDFDSYWEGGQRQPVDYDPNWIAHTLASLHDPTGEAFQAAITDQSRKLFREGR